MSLGSGGLLNFNDLFLKKTFQLLSGIIVGKISLWWTITVNFVCFYIFFKQSKQFTKL